MFARAAGGLIAALALCSQAAGAQPVAPLPFDRILRHDELTALLQQWAGARPELVQLESLGETPRGRAMWFLTLTNRATGPVCRASPRPC